MSSWGAGSVTSPTYDELQPGNHLTGHCLRYPNRRKTLVNTSPILSVDFKQGIVETLNTMYRLGKRSDAYKAWFNKRGAGA